MVKTASTMMPLGAEAPDFSLPNTIDDKVMSLADFKEKQALLMMFICNHCPFVVHVQEELARVGRDYQDKDIAIVAVSANDANNYPDDAPALLKERAEQLGYTFPYLYDESQSTAKAYSAACTPDFFLFDADRKLVYRGQMDSSRPGNNIPVTGVDLRRAIDALLDGQSISTDQTPSIGCNIKWKEGNEPDYFNP
jgi:peroxiredoxin